MTASSVAPGACGQLGHRRTPAELLHQCGRGVPQFQVELLHPAAGPDRPALVAEMALELTDDRPGGEGGEVDPSAPGRTGRPTSPGRPRPPGPDRPAARPGAGNAERVGGPSPRLAVIMSSRARSESCHDGLLVRQRRLRRERSRAPSRQSPFRRLRSQARTEPSVWLAAVLVDQRGQNLLAQLVRLGPSPSGGHRRGRTASVQAMSRARRTPELQAKIAVTGVAALEGQQAQLTDGQAKIL